MNLYKSLKIYATAKICKCKVNVLPHSNYLPEVSVLSKNELKYFDDTPLLHTSDLILFEGHKIYSFWPKHAKARLNKNIKNKLFCITFEKPVCERRNYVFTSRLACQSWSSTLPTEVSVLCPGHRWPSCAVASDLPHLLKNISANVSPNPKAQ